VIFWGREEYQTGRDLRVGMAGNRWASGLGGASTEWLCELTVSLVGERGIGSDLLSVGLYSAHAVRWPERSRRDRAIANRIHGDRSVSLLWRRHGQPRSDHTPLAGYTSRSSMGPESEGAWATCIIRSRDWNSISASLWRSHCGRRRVVSPPVLGVATRGGNHRHTNSRRCG
jgi:hypothetical protein